MTQLSTLSTILALLLMLAGFRAGLLIGEDLWIEQVVQESYRLHPECNRMNCFVAAGPIHNFDTGIRWVIGRWSAECLHIEVPGWFLAG